MKKAIAIFFGLFFFLVALLFWAKTGPANAGPHPLTVPQILISQTQPSLATLAA